MIAAPTIEQHLKDTIESQGKIPFKQFMQCALYGENGYYQNSQPVFGAQGDFVTAPEMSSLFGKIIAKQIGDVLSNIEPPYQILEIGPGSGKLAFDIINTLTNEGISIERYHLVETSETLTQIQQQRLNAFKLCQWSKQIPEHSFKGIILANELFDALAVHKVRLTPTPQEWYVNVNKDGFYFELGPISDPKLHAAIDDILGDLNHALPEPYDTEINLAQNNILNRCAASLTKGIMLFVDYGFDRLEYYHPCRNTGTLMAHHHHKATADVLAKAGEQDITAHVDFTALTKCVHSLGFDLLGYTTQAHFLLGLDVLSLAKSLTPAETHALQTLLAPQEMGELIKVIAFGKAYDQPLRGFEFRDLSYKI